jgi:hypothetical protein
METKKVVVTMRDLKKFSVLKDVLAKKITGLQAAVLLGLSAVHISRLKKRLLQAGFEGLLRRTNPKPPANRVTAATIAQMIKLRNAIYYDLNILHFKDKLAELHNIHCSYETIRQVLMHHQLHTPRKRKKIHRQRRRMPKAGMLVQMDSSEHQWLAHIPEPWWLVAMIDDASNEIPYAQFFPKDTLYANMHVLRRTIETKGIFYALYTDKASHFKTTRHGGLHYNVAQDHEETQIERALQELDINLIPANSPEAKGRIEVTFRFFQDRFIKEMRLAGIQTYEQANQYLIEKFLPWYNARYTHQVESVYRPLSPDINLDLVFCIKKNRQVNNDNTISVYNQIVQIPPHRRGLAYAQKTVEVCILEDHRIYVVYHDEIIAEDKLKPNNPILRKEKTAERLLNKRIEPTNNNLKVRKRPIYPPLRPTANHPWKRFVHPPISTTSKT